MRMRRWRSGVFAEICAAEVRGNGGAAASSDRIRIILCKRIGDRSDRLYPYPSNHQPDLTRANCDYRPHLGSGVVWSLACL